jgi:hypothetical protein
MVTFKLISKLISDLGYNKKLDTCLLDPHYVLLQQAYLSTVMQLTRFATKDGFIEIFIDFFYFEWKKFKFFEKDELDKVFKNSLIAFPMFSEKWKNIP